MVFLKNAIIIIIRDCLINYYFSSVFGAQEKYYGAVELSWETLYGPREDHRIPNQEWLVASIWKMCFVLGCASKRKFLFCQRIYNIYILLLRRDQFMRT